MLIRLTKNLSFPKTIPLLCQTSTRSFWGNSKKAPKQSKEPKEASQGSGNTSEVDSDEEFTVKVKEIKKLIMEQDEEIEDLKKEFAAVVALYQKQVEDNDKSVKKWVRKVDYTKKSALEKFSEDVLTIKDTLEDSIADLDSHSLEKSSKSSPQEQYEAGISGLETSLKKFDEVMAKYHIEQFNPIGEKFDPQVHEAMMMVNDPSKDPNTVCMVMETGWKIGERVLRAAKVGCVAKRG
ncbi:unnamed protein product [Moneuplotes crassus]|uniref:GrpE protein homolog n=1 Tax=Euplotes crassus TaxID=5936 RepID=A0AAD1XTB4_EUPCR|nr:unnamed protein product [Moneuplotes crassus]